MSKRLFRPHVLERLRFFALSALLGVVVSLATLLLIDMILLVQSLFFGQVTDENMVEIVSNSPPWLVVFTPLFGGLLVGILIHFLDGQRYHGIADVMESCAVKGARMDVRSGAGAAIAAAISMGSGAPVGREGPAVHIGASISAWLAEKLKFQQSDSLALLGCGAAAAVTASFNAPIAGVLFALEVIVGYYTMRVFAPVVIASAASVIVRHNIVGDYSIFHLPSFEINSLWEMLIFGLLGILCAGFVLCMIVLVGRIQKFWALSCFPLWARPAIAGLFIGAIATQMPHILGSGFEAIDQTLNQTMLPGALLSLLLLRLIGTSAALGSGFAGGVFTPSLVFGAIFGGLLWSVVALLFPNTVSAQGVYSIVGMGALASAMLGAPISTVLIVFELTANYDVTIAVMFAAAMASTTMQLSPHTSYFRWQLANRGVNITTGRDQSLLRTKTLEHLVRQECSFISADDKIIDTERQLSRERHLAAVFLNENNELLGSASLRLLVSASIDHGFDAYTASVLNSAKISVSEHTNLVAALQTMAEHNLDYLTVVTDVETDRQFKGVVYRSDLMKAYYNVVRDARAEEFGVN